MHRIDDDRRVQISQPLEIEVGVNLFSVTRNRGIELVGIASSRSSLWSIRVDQPLNCRCRFRCRASAPGSFDLKAIKVWWIV